MAPSPTLESLGGRGRVQLGRPASTDRTSLDTFDARLGAAGWTCWRSAPQARSESDRLTLEEPGRPPIAVTVKPERRDRVLGADLPPTVPRLRSLIGERALINRVRVRTRLQPAAVCNRDGKTVVRLVVDEPQVVLARGLVHPLSRRLWVMPVLGYDREFRRVTDLVRDRLGLSPVPQSVLDEALAVAGIPVAGVSADVDVSLDPAMPADEAAVRICRGLADVANANLAGTLADLDVEFLHDLRVAVRRSRSVLKEMKEVFPRDVAERARVDLRWIQAITGPTRDLDVLLHQWPAMASAVSSELGPHLEPLHQVVVAERGRAFRAMARQLRGSRFRAAWGAWTSALDDRQRDGGDVRPDPPDSVGRLAGRRIRSVYRKMLDMGSAIDDDSPPEELHELRKRGKELRYLLELFGGLWPTAAVKPLVGSLKGLQDVLGRFQDDQIQAGYLRGLASGLPAADSTETLLALGALIDGLAADQQAARDAFTARFAPFAGRENRRVVDTVFRPPKR